MNKQEKQQIIYVCWKTQTIISTQFKHTTFCFHCQLTEHIFSNFSSHGSVSSTKCTLHWAKTGIIIVVTTADSITCFSQPNMLALIQQKNLN